MLLNACAYLLVYLWVDAQQERAFERAAGTEPTVLISVDAADIRSGNAYQSDEHEWSINGKLYDVCSIAKAGDRFLLTCYHDTREECAREGLETSLGTSPGMDTHKHPTSKTTTEKDVKYFPARGQDPALLILAGCWSLPPASSYHAPSGAIDSPPPRWISSLI